MFDDDFVIEDPLRYHYVPDTPAREKRTQQKDTKDRTPLNQRSEYLSLGPPSVRCQYCSALMWKEERVNKKELRAIPEFSICCGRGTIRLDKVKQTPPYLLSLHQDEQRGPSFKRLIRAYNSMLAFTSMGGKIDYSINKSRGPYVFKLNGVNYHRFGSLIPNNGDEPKFCQLYIYDTENEVENRIKSIGGQDGNEVDPNIVEGLVNMLDGTNEVVKRFRRARERFEAGNVVGLKVVMQASRSESGHENALQKSNEIAAVMVGENDYTCGKRDIVVENNDGTLKRISDLHPLYMALQYPLLFPYAEDGFHEEIYYKPQRSSKSKKRQKVTMREFYSYKLQVRENEGTF